MFQHPIRLFAQPLMLLTVLIVTLPASAAAAEAVDETVIVTASRLNQTASELGSSVSIITREAIEAAGYDFAIDAIASAPGVTVNQNGGFGGAASVRIRGAATDQTLVLIDGIAVNDPSAPGGGFDFSRIDTASIERIEILKGPQSTLWGTDAIGGVVSIITRRGEQGLGGSLAAEYGSFDTRRGSAAVGGANERGAFRVSVNTIDSDGISKADEDNGNREDDGYDATTVNATASLNLPAAAQLSLALRYSDAETDFDSFVFGNQGNVGDGNDTSETEELSGQLALNLPLFEGRLDNQLLIGHATIDRASFSNGSPSFSADGKRDTYRYQGTFTFNDRNRLALGAERERNDNRSVTSTIDGLFALYEFQPTDTLSLTAGLRNDDVEAFGSETTGRIAVSWNPAAQWTLRGSWGQGFKAPTLFQGTFFCCGATAPNTDLAPETSRAFDAGVEWRTTDGRGALSATYFDQDTDDLITFSFAAGGYENIAEAQSRGVELAGSWRLNEWLAINASYAYIDAQDKSSGNRLIRVPRHSGDVTLALDPGGRWSAQLLVRHNGSERDTSDTLADWTRVDVSGRVTLREDLELFARIENLFDADYQQIIGYGTPGLSAAAGVRLRF